MQEAAAVKESCVRNNGLASLVDGRCSKCDNCSADAGVYDHLEGESLRARL
jgi:hypothetical protein